MASTTLNENELGRWGGKKALLQFVEATLVSNATSGIKILTLLSNISTTVLHGYVHCDLQQWYCCDIEI